MDKSRGKGKCFVCGKKGYWSTNHPKDERSWRIQQYIINYKTGDDISDSKKPTGSIIWIAIIDWELNKGGLILILEAKASKGENLLGRMRDYY